MWLGADNDSRPFLKNRLRGVEILLWMPSMGFGRVPEFQHALVAAQHEAPVKNIGEVASGGVLSQQSQENGPLILAKDAGVTDLALGNYNKDACGTSTLEKRQADAVVERRKDQLERDGLFYRHPKTPEQEQQNEKAYREYLDALIKRATRARQQEIENCDLSGNSG